MGKLILHTGPAGPYYFFRDKICEHLSADRTGFIYLLPVNRAVRYLKRDLIKDLAPKTLADPNIFTFNGLFRFLYQKMPDRKIVAGKMIRLTLLNYLFQRYSENLEYFRSGRGRLVVKIDQMLAEMLEFGIYNSPEIEPPDTCIHKFKDFQRIIHILFEQYGETLIDEHALPDRVIQSLNESILQKYLGRDLKIYVNGYGIYTPPMIRLLQRLKYWCDIEVKIDYVSENMNLFRHTRDAYEMLGRFADQEIMFQGGDQTGKKMFDQRASGSYQKSETKRISKLGAKNPHDEIMQIAATVRQWHREQIPLHHIGITFPNLEVYAPLIRRIFGKYKIPYNLSTGFSLSESPLILAYLQVLVIVISGYNSAEIHKLLISPFCRLADGIDGHIFLKLTSKLRIRHVTGDWQKRFISAIGEDGAKFTLPEEILKVQIEKIEKILNRLKTLEHPGSAEDLYNRFLGTLQDLGMLEWYNPDEKQMTREQREKEFRAFNRFIKLIEQVKWILDYIFKNEPVSTEDFYRYLKPVIQEATYNLKEWAEYGVQIMPRLEILSLSCKKMIIGGLIEGDFPRRYTRDIFFNDMERHVLGLNAAEDLVAQDRFLFYQLIMSQAEEIILTHPAFDGEAALLPSTFIENLNALYHTENKETVKDGHHLVTADSFLEEFSGKLNEHIGETDLNDLLTWSSLFGKENVISWLDGIAHYLTKQFRNMTGSFEGNLTDHKSIRSILQLEHGERRFSVSALESYAFCPMQYFMQRILGLDEEEPPEEYISAREKGSLIHNILFNFYTYLREEKATDRPWQFRDRLFAITGTELNKLPYEGLLWTVEIESLYGNDTRQGLLDTFLQEEASFLVDSGYIPRFFELAFGPAGRHQACDPASRFEPLKFKKNDRTVLLTGKIDRIDINEARQVLIFDYKLSAGTKGRQLNDMISGLSLQLPVYALAVMKMFPDLRPVAAAYYQVRDADNCERKFMFADGSVNHHVDLPQKNILPEKGNTRNETISFEELLNITEDHLFRHVDEMLSGYFTHTLQPEDDRCSKYCGFSRICRKDVGKLMQMGTEERS